MSNTLHTFVNVGNLTGAEAEQKEPWTVFTSVGVGHVIFWTPREAQKWLEDPNRMISVYDAAGKLIEVQFASAIIAARRGKPSQIAVPVNGQPTQRIVPG